MIVWLAVILAEAREILRAPIHLGHRPKGLIHRICDAFSITEIGAVDG